MGFGSAALAAEFSHFQKRNPKLRSKHPNILFICTDYQAGEDGPSLGSPFLDMPALDRLCRNGIVFSRYYSTAPVCQPARCTWITGQYPHTHGMWGNYNQWIPQTCPILMKELANSGYYTMGIGKMHFKPWNRTEGFHRMIHADRKANLESDKEYLDDYARFLSQYDLNRWDYLKLQYEPESPHVYDWPFSPETHIDHYVGTQAQRAIQEGFLDDKGPWFLWVSFNGPHNPWDPPAEFSRPYMTLDLPSPRTYPGELSDKPLAQTRARYGYTKEVPDYIDRYPENEKDYLKQIRASHYGNLTFIDRQVQKILEALEQKNILRDTIIIYSADHGSLLGDHGIFHKGNIYERSARVPFVVHSPARYKPGRTEALASHVDFMPTILSLAGAPIPSEVEGRDLTPLFSGEKKSIQDRLFIEISHNIGIIKDNWKMFVYSNGEGELYDIRTDPDEFKNLYYTPEYAEKRYELREDLIAFRKENTDFFKTTPSAPALPNQKEYRFNQGDILIQNQKPFPPAQGGKSIRILAKIGSSTGQAVDGAFFVCEEKIPAWPERPPQNGYALYLDDGRLAMGVRLWDKDTIITSPELVPDEEFEVDACWERDGKITLKVNGNTVAAGKTDSGLPKRRGRFEVVAPSIHVGRGHAWGTAIGDYQINTDFTGKIHFVVLKLN